MGLVKLVYGLNINGYVVIGISEYNYACDNIVLELMRKFKKVQIDDWFDADISFLPEGITHLNIGCSFNHSLENLPSTLKHLQIAKYNEVGYNVFNKPLDYLPQGLESLHIGFTQSFNNSIDNLPSSLKSLTIINNDLDININNLPNSIENLNVKKFDFTNTFNLPSNLQKMKISSLQKNKPGFVEFIQRFANRNIEFYE